MVLNKKFVIKLIAGRLTRGLMWFIGSTLTAIGITSISLELQRSTATSVALIVTGVAVDLLAAWWSSRKDKKLLAAMPPVLPHGGATL